MLFNYIYKFMELFRPISTSLSFGHTSLIYPITEILAFSSVALVCFVVAIIFQKITDYDVFPFTLASFSVLFITYGQSAFLHIMTDFNLIKFIVVYLLADTAICVILSLLIYALRYQQFALKNISSHRKSAICILIWYAFLCGWAVSFACYPWESATGAWMNNYAFVVDLILWGGALLTVLLAGIAYSKAKYKEKHYLSHWKYEYRRYR